MSSPDSRLTHSPGSPSRKRLRCALGVACIASLTFSTPGYAQTCDDADELPVLKEEWLLAQLDCGKEALKEAAIDKAKSMLKDFAMDLVAQGVNSYFPGLGSMLFSSGSDPFAAHADRIIDRIDAAEANIIQAIFDMHEREANLSIEQLKADLRLMSDQQFHLKVDNADFFRATLSELRLRATDLTWPKASSTGDLSRLTTEDLPKLHAIALLYSLMVDLIPETAVLENTRSWSRATGRPLLELADADLARIQEDAEQQTLRELEDLIAESVVPYLQAIDSLDLFRKASDERFGDIIHQPRPSSSTNCPSSDSQWYFVDGIGRYDHTFVADRGTCTHPGLTRRPVSCIEFYDCIDDNPGTLTVTTLLGTVSHRVASRADANEFVEDAYATELDQQYFDYLSRTYGAVHPLLTSWADLVSSAMPEFVIDEELDEAVMPGLRFNPYYGMRWDGSEMVDIGNGTAWSDSLAETNYKTFLDVVGDRRNFTAWDRRWAVDRTLAYGPTAVGFLGLVPPLVDGLGPKYPMSILRPMLRIETERDANPVERTTAALFFYIDQFAAKHASLL